MMNNSKLFLLATPLVLLLVVSATHNLQSASAWDFGPWFGGQGFHHWLGGFDNGHPPYNNGYQAGIADAVYDHDQGLVYNPYPQCCHSELYRHVFQEGHDQQWNTYQSQEQQTNQRSNIYINNSPGAYVNTEQSSNQGQSQEQGQEPRWTSPQCQQCLNSNNVNDDCSDGCP